MSDLFDTTQKTLQGAEWRGTINVNIDGDTHELSVRQLVEDEFTEVMKMIDRGELADLRDQLPTDKMQEYRELQDKDELGDGERMRMESLEQDLNQTSTLIFDVLSLETFRGIRQAAKYAVEPDDADLKEAMYEHADEIEQEYGYPVKTPDDCYEYCKDQVETIVDKSTNFQGFVIGIQALTTTVGDEGN